MGVYEFSVRVYDQATKQYVGEGLEKTMVQVLGVGDKNIIPFNIFRHNNVFEFANMGQGPLCPEYTEDNGEKVRFGLRRKGGHTSDSYLESVGKSGFDNILILDPWDPTLIQESKYPHSDEIQLEYVKTNHFDRWKLDLGTTLKEITKLNIFKIHNINKILDTGFRYQIMGYSYSDKKSPSDIQGFYDYTNSTIDKLDKLSQYPEYAYRFLDISDPSFYGKTGLRYSFTAEFKENAKPSAPTIRSVPSGGKSIETIFNIDQLWATENAPLYFKYEY